MTVPQILNIVGMVLLVAAVALGALAFYVYRRLDIKGVRDDLSGRARQADIAAGGATIGTRTRRATVGSPLRARAEAWDGSVHEGKTDGESRQKAPARQQLRDRLGGSARRDQRTASPKPSTVPARDIDSTTTVLSHSVAPQPNSDESNQRAGLVIQHSVIRTDGDPLILPNTGE